MPTLYFVKDWETCFENSESRKVKVCRYVYTPNKHDGSRYGRMMAHPEGERLFAAWNAIIQVASKMVMRGILYTGAAIPEFAPETSGCSAVKTFEIMTAQDLAFRTGLKVATFEMALDFFSSDVMGWLGAKVINSEEKSHNSKTSESAPGISGDYSDFSPLKGREGKGREENKTPPTPTGENTLKGPEAGNRIPTLEAPHHQLVDGHKGTKTSKGTRQNTEPKTNVPAAGSVGGNILDYLNKKTGKNFRVAGAAQKLIAARMKEGFTEEDFKRVIDNKVADWLNNPEMEMYLRPTTLFQATKMDGYLNQKNGARPRKENPADLIEDFTFTGTDD